MYQALEISTRFARIHANELTGRRSTSTREEGPKAAGGGEHAQVERVASQCGPLQRRMGQCHFWKGEKDETLAELQRALISLGAEPHEIAELPRSTLSRRYSYQRYIYATTRPKAYSNIGQSGAGSASGKPPQSWLERRIEQVVTWPSHRRHTKRVTPVTSP